MGKIGIAILAAGASRRLGEPKQLLRISGKSLLRHAAEEALATEAACVVVVLGAYAEKVMPELEGLNVRIAENHNWQEGMASSIRAAIGQLQAAQVNAALLMLCDQPLIERDFLQKMMTVWRRVSVPIVAAGYGGTVGAPALFESSCFDELMNLRGERGARQLIHQYQHEVVPCPAGVVDIDTPEHKMALEIIFKLKSQ
ncbi:MAG: NTP transferase domain-containing protein [Candidatus Thermochlorobacter sp.]